MHNSEDNGLFHREFVRNKIFVLVVFKMQNPGNNFLVKISKKGNLE